MDELEEEKEEQEDKGAFALDASDSLYSVDFLEEVEEKESKRFSRTDSHASKRRVSRRKGRMNTNTSCADLFFLWRWRQTLCVFFTERANAAGGFLYLQENHSWLYAAGERDQSVCLAQIEIESEMQKRQKKTAFGN